MMKIDYKKILPIYKAKHNDLQIVTVPSLQYLMINGTGDPNTSDEFSNAIKALYPIAFKIKFASKIQLKKDYVVMPLEGLWWSNDMSFFTSARDKSRWNWTLMIMQPEWITKKMFEEAVQKVKEKETSAGLDKVRLETISEGLCVQTLHVGSFDDEADILAKMHNEFISSQGLKMTQKHHEIYLSDFRKVAPSKLRTILRQPVVRK